MVGEIILLVLEALLLIGLIIVLFVDKSTWTRSDGIVYGFFVTLLSVTLVAGICTVYGESHPNKYLNKYQNKMENVEKCQIDTTYTITGKQVDTTYTIYYTTKKEK